MTSVLRCGSRPRSARSVPANLRAALSLFKVASKAGIRKASKLPAGAPLLKLALTAKTPPRLKRPLSALPVSALAFTSSAGQSRSNSSACAACMPRRRSFRSWIASVLRCESNPKRSMASVEPASFSPAALASSAMRSDCASSAPLAMS